MYPNDSTSTNFKVVFIFLRPQSVEVESGRVYTLMAQVAYKYTWTLPWLHGLDNYSLGMNLNWHGHKSGLDKISCSINFAHCSGVKNHFYFPTFHTWVVFYIPELFSVPKNTFFVSCFRAAYRHLVPRSVYHERCRLKLAAAALCTTGNRHTVRRRHPTHCSNADVLCFSEIIFCGYFYMIFNAPLLLLCSKGQFAWWWQICLNIKMHGRSPVLPIHGKLYHTLSLARYLCFVVV